VTTDRPLRIVLVQLFELPSAMAHAIQIVCTAEALARRGHEVVLHAKPGRAGGSPLEAAETILGRALPPGLTVEALPFRHKGLAGLDYRRRLATHVLRAAGRTVFYARGRRQAVAVLRIRRALRKRTPLVYEFHNVEHVVQRESGRERRAADTFLEERRIAREADGLTAISEPLADDVAELFDVARPTIVADGVDLERFRGIADPFSSDAFTPDALKKDGWARIVYAGSLYPHKGVEGLVHMLCELPEHVRLTIVGGNPPKELDRLRALAVDLAVAPRIAFTGQRTPPQVADELAKADLIVLPAAAESRSQRYTSPLKLFEAMATGAPIVAAPSASLTSILRDGETAFVATSGAPADLAAAVLRALDAGPARAIGRAARDAAEAYGWSQRAERIEAVLRPLMDSSSRP